MKKSKKKKPALQTVWTIGHSTRSAEDFKQILEAHRIEALVDVRQFPGSRRYPHFNKPELAKSLEAVGIQYLHLEELGGRRQPRADSRNTAWKNAAFRGYADYMETTEFEKGMSKLMALAESKNAAVMCAEALWWRCHRGLISDFLKARGIEVIHILDDKKTESHPYTTAVRIVDGRLSYEGLLVGLHSRNKS